MSQSTASSEPSPSFSHAQILEIVGALILCLFVASLSQTVVATALPTIVGELGGQDQLAWIVTATMLTATISTPLWGKLSDIYGRKSLLQLAISWFAVASVLAGLAQSMSQLVAARACQGIGIGGIMALSQAIMGDVVSPRERGRYGGYLGASFGAATVAGPLIGGFLVDGAGWRWCFYVGIPVAVAALIVLHYKLRTVSVRRDVRVDWWGATFICASATALLLLLSLAGHEFEWASWWTVLLGGIASVSLVVAIVIERRVPEPILAPRLFRDRTFSLTSAAGFFVGAAMFATMIYLPQYLQVVRGKTPTESGLLMLPLIVTMLVFSVLSGKAITKWGRWKVFPVVGLFLLGTSASFFTTIEPGTSLWMITSYMTVAGAGLGCTMQVLILAVQNATRQTDLGIATSASMFFRSMGSAVGIALFGAILTSRLTSAIPELLAERGIRPPESSGSMRSKLGTPDQIAALHEPLRTVVREGFTLGLDRIYLVTIPLVALGLLAMLAVKELPLRRGSA